MLVLQLRTETRGAVYIQGDSLVLTHAWTVLEVNYFRCVDVSGWRLSICHLVHLTFAPRFMSKYKRSDYLKEASSLGVLLVDIWGGLAFTPTLSWVLRYWAPSSSCLWLVLWFSLGTCSFQEHLQSALHWRLPDNLFQRGALIHFTDVTFLISSTQACVGFQSAVGWASAFLNLGKSYLLVQGVVSISLETEQVLGWFPLDLVESLARRSVLCVDVDCLFPSYKDTVLGGGGCKIGKQRRREGRCPAVTLSHFTGSGDSFYNKLALMLTCMLVWVVSVLKYPSKENELSENEEGLPTGSPFYLRQWWRSGMETFSWRKSFSWAVKDGWILTMRIRTKLLYY